MERALGYVIPRRGRRGIPAVSCHVTFRDSSLQLGMTKTALPGSLRPLRLCGKSFPLLHRITQDAETFDFDLDDVAGPEVGLGRSADPGGRAGRDQIAGLERQEAGDPLNRFGNRE